MISADPAATPVTTPFSSTVAYELALDVHVISEPAGATSVLRVIVLPTSTEASVGLTEIYGVTDEFLRMLIRL